MELSIVVPTYNEADNLEPLLRALGRSLDGVNFEVLICDDDSPDLTWARAEEIGRQDPRVRVLRRRANPGLGHAVVDGFQSAQGDIVTCIDADLQHDPGILPQMLLRIREGYDLVIGSRYVPGGGTGNWSRIRRLESWLATKLTRKVVRIDLHDPMSGYFMLRRQDFLRVRRHLNPEGFKILLEIAAFLSPCRAAEVSYTFRKRERGQSKLSGRVVLAFLRQLWRLSPLERWLPAEFVKFGIVGSAGVLVNLGAMATLLHFTSYQDWRASAIATLIATLNNYVLNNFWTFRDRAHAGITLLWRYPYYVIACLAGLSVTTAAYSILSTSLRRLYGSTPKVELLMLCQLVAILSGTVSNYVINRSFTWPKKSCVDRAPVASVIPDAEDPAVRCNAQSGSGL